MPGETPQQAADRMLIQHHHARLYGLPAPRETPDDRLHDRYCRCRACKPPLVGAAGRRRSVARMVVAALLLMGVLTASPLMALLLR